MDLLGTVEPVRDQDDMGQLANGNVCVWLGGEQLCGSMSEQVLTGSVSDCSQVFLGSLLVFNDFSSPRCISKQELKDLADRSQTKYWNKWNVSVRLPDSRSCMQAAQEMRGAGNNRCVSPWRYR